jgi:hypothetical protein
MFEVVGIRPEILKKAKKVIVTKFDVQQKTIFIDMVWIDSDGRHEHTVSCDRSVNPTVNILDALWCDCTTCSSFNIKTKEWCRLKTRAAQELISRKFWPKMVERYLYGDDKVG